MNLLVDAPTVGRKRTERQTHAQILCAIRCACAELSKLDRLVVERGNDLPIRVRFERDVTAEPGEQCGRRGLALSHFSTSAQAE